ncbi:Esterase EstB [compost metagenome]
MPQISDIPSQSLAPAPEFLGKDFRTRLDEVVDMAIAQQRIVGTVVTVLHDGVPIYRRSAGFSDRENGVPMEDGLVFRWASLSKTVLSALTLAVVDHGLMSLDDKITQWLPDFTPTWKGAIPQITVRQLLTHTAGLAYPFFEPDGAYSRVGVSSGTDCPGMTFEDELQRITEAGLIYAPGTQWAYSLSLDVLGAALEKATGKPLAQVMKQYISAPLGLNTMDFTIAEGTALAKPYVREPAGTIVEMEQTHAVEFPGPYFITICPDRVYDTLSFPSGGAGMVGTIDEFASVLEMIRQNGNPCLKPQSAQAMLDNQTADIENMMGPGWGFTFGGARVMNPAATDTPLPEGTVMWSGAYGHSWLIDPRNKLTMVLMTNTTPEGDWGDYPCAFRDAIYGVTQE